jgi:dTDP-4-amino-4,6-dideoxygalactose transaminase
MGFKVQDSKNNTFAYLSALAPGEINRDELFNKLRKKGIYCSRIWQRPIILSGPLSELSSDRTIFSNTIKATKTIINLPLQNWHSKKDVNKIIRNLTRILYQHNI